VTAVLYVRKSRDEESVADALDLQRRALERLAQERGILEYDVVTEIGSGATLADRPRFVEVLGRVQAGEVSVIIAAHEDRLTRADTLEGAYITNILAQAGVRVLTPAGEVDLRDDAHALLWDVKRALSRYELSSYKRRVKAANNERARQGKPSNGTFQKFGYRWDRERQVYEPSEDYPALVWLFEAVRERGVAGVAREGRERFPRFPTSAAVWHIVHDPFFSGRPAKKDNLPESEWVYADNPPKYPHPVTPTQHAALLELLRLRRRNKDPQAWRDVWCSKLAVCPEGHRMTSAGPVYACNHTADGGNHISISKHRLEYVVTEAVLAVLSNRDFMEAVVARAAEALKDRRKNAGELQAAHRRAQAEAARYEKLLQAAFEQHSLGGIGEGEYEKWREEYRRGLAAARSEAERARRALEAPAFGEEALRPIRRLLADPERFWARMQPSEKRAVARALIDRVDVSPAPGNPGGQQPRYSLQVRYRVSGTV
jgi:DNA invertase Pin-like site-specific DNA recombinase